MKTGQYLVLALFLLCATQLCAMTVSSTVPGNIFVAGSPMRFSMTGVRGGVHYTLTDYFGTVTATGQTFNGAINLPGQREGWYTLACSGPSGSTEAYIGVVKDRGTQPLPADGRICTDACIVWLAPKEYHQSIAKMVRLAGIPWVRDRLGWNPVETARDKFTWVRDYDEPTELFAAEGVRVCSAWHDSPAWTHPSNPNGTCPEDLRDVYGYCKAQTSHLKGKLQAIEVWNEPDGGWFKEIGDAYAGFMKASYLGAKDGNPQVKVLTGSICAGDTPFLQNISESGIADYYDVFNWHSYTGAAGFVNILGQDLNVLRANGCYARPAWMTEAGLGTQGTLGEKKLLLADGEKRRQCQYVPQAAVSALAAGTEKFFFFVLSSCQEGSTQWGLLRPDIMPNPGFVALSAAANIIGRSTYLGAYPAGDGVTAQVFSTPRGTVLVAWADKPTAISIPSEQHAVTMADIFGKERRVAVSGTLPVTVGPDAVYVIDTGKRLTKSLVKPAPLRMKQGVNHPSRIVLVGRCAVQTAFERSAYSLSRDTNGTIAPLTYNVEVYNFNQTGKPITGTVTLTLPTGWRADTTKRTVTVAPMGREVLAFTLTPTVSPEYPMKVVVHGTFAGKVVAKSTSYFTTDPEALKPTKSVPLPWTDAAAWVPSAGCGSVKVSNPVDGTLQFDCHFDQKGDRWAYPSLKIKLPNDVGQYDGIAFDVEAAKADPNTRINMMLVEAEEGGKLTPQYMGGVNMASGKRRALIFFRDMRWLFWISGPDPVPGLAPEKIFMVKLGCNTSSDDVSFKLSNFALVKFAH